MLASGFNLLRQKLLIIKKTTMKQHFFRAMLLALPLLGALHLSAQNKTDRFAIQPKNTLIVGMNLAVNESYNQLSYFYRNEYIRRFSHLFEGGVGLGFYNYQKTQSTMTDLNGRNNVVYKSFAQTSIVSLDIIGYIDIVNKRRNLLRFGVGYSLRFDQSLIPVGMYLVKNSSGEYVYITDYHREKGTDGGVIVHLGYGYRITPRFTTAVSARYYSEGKYVSLSMVGLDFSYSF